MISRISFSQVKEQGIIKESVISLLDSLIPPPQNCKSAFDLMANDSMGGELVYNSLLKEQSERVSRLYTELTIMENKFKSERSSMKRNPNGEGPPQGGPPSGGPPPGGMGPPGGMDNMPDEMIELRDDLSEAVTALDKITVTREKLKNELKKSTENTNVELHKTLQTDTEMHINIVNQLLESGSKKYDKTFRSIRKNMLKIDDIIKKYDYGSKIKFSPVKAEIVKLQFEQISNINFLLNVTKELATIGSKFYKGSQN
ncbi:MAG: hypothetical protein IPL53_20155 [Ignavibacteria bacterium]|nr:hypothetical protein [Ignavibacteria bacterium]